MFTAIYYWIYYYLSKVKTNDDPAFNGLMILILLEATNIISVGRIIYNITQFRSNAHTAYVYAIIFVLCVIAFNLFYFYRRRQFIFKKVSGYNPNRLKLTKYVFWIYFIGSLGFLLGVVHFS
jgi:ABC-type Fe3+ transport system permease subunit